MPTYEYACKSCGHEWEEIQKISEAPLTECPQCHQAEAQRLISGGNFILKGGGWYADAYSSVKPKADSGKSESKSPAKSESKSEGKSEAATPAAAASPTPSSAPAAPSTTPSSTPTKT